MVPPDPHHAGGASTMSAQFGMINALRTGNAMVDMFICMLIPFIFQLLASFGATMTPLIAEIIKAWKSRHDKVVRKIEYEVSCLFQRIFKGTYCVKSFGLKYKIILLYVLYVCSFA